VNVIKKSEKNRRRRERERRGREEPRNSGIGVIYY